MHPDLERLLSEDEAARGGVEDARARARARLDAVREELASRRHARLGELQRDLDRTLAQIQDDTDHEVERRQAQRHQRGRDDAERTDAFVDAAADAWVDIVRSGRISRGSP
jgi:hypothetical protein